MELIVEVDRGHNSLEETSYNNAPSQIGKYFEIVIEQELSKRKAVILENALNNMAFDKLKLTKQLLYLNLSNNSHFLNSKVLDAFPAFPELIKLDLSFNGLLESPSTDFFKKIPKLRILYIHDNLLSDEKIVYCLGPLRYLKYITIFNNPCEQKDIRAKLILHVKSLKAIDFRTIIDSERGVPVIKHINKKKFQISKLVWPLFACADYLDEREVINAVFNELYAIHKVYIQGSDVTRMQALFRGMIARKKMPVNIIKNNKAQKAKANYIAKVWKKNARLYRRIREALEERGRLDIFYPPKFIRRRRVYDLVREFIVKMRENVIFQKKFRKMKTMMLQSFNKQKSLYKTPDTLFNIMKYRCFYIHGSQVNLFFDIVQELKLMMGRVCELDDVDLVIDQIKKNMENADSIYTLRIPGILETEFLKTIPMIQLIRTSMRSVFRYKKLVKEPDYYLKVCQIIPIKRKMTWHMSNKDKEKYQRCLNKVEKLDSSKYNQLIRVNIPYTKVLYFLIQRLFAYNRSINEGERLFLFFDEGLRRLGSAVLIQASYRRRLALRKLPYRDMVWETTKFRAAVFIQRWLRSFKFKCRMYLLHSLNHYLRQISTPSLYIEEEVYINILEIIEEQKKKLHLRDQDLRVWVSLNSNMVFASRDYPKDEKFRNFLPDWIDCVKHVPITDTMQVREGDFMHFLHIGTRIKRKIKYDIKYYKFSFSSVEQARYVAAALAYLSFTTRESGCYLKFIDKGNIKTYLAKSKETRLKELLNIYGIRIKDVKPADKGEFMKRNENTVLIKHYDNCGFLFTKAHSYFKDLAEKNSRNQFYQIRVNYVKGLRKRTYLQKDEQHKLQTYRYHFDYIYFIPYNYFVGLIRYQEVEGFSILKTLITEGSGTANPEDLVFPKIDNPVDKMDTKKKLIKHTNILNDLYKQKEVAVRKREMEENRVKIQVQKEEEIKHLREKAQTIREYATFKKEIIEKEKAMLVHQKVNDKNRVKNESEILAREKMDQSIREKQDLVKKLKIEKEIKREENAKGKVPVGFFASINLLLGEETRATVKNQRLKDREENRKKVAQIKEKRLEDKAWSLILREVKKPVGASYLKDDDKAVLDQSFSIQMARVGLSLEGDKIDNYPIPTHPKLRMILDPYRTRGYSQGTGKLTTEALNQTFANPTNLNNENSFEDNSLNKSAFPYIHGKIAEEFYPIIKKKDQNAIILADL